MNGINEFIMWTSEHTTSKKDSKQFFSCFKGKANRKEQADTIMGFRATRAYTKFHIFIRKSSKCIIFELYAFLSLSFIIFWI